MPTYSFYCDHCGNEEEIYLKHMITDEEKNRKCKCSKLMELEIFSPTDIKFCELGRYIQDRGFNNENPEYNFRRKLKQEKEKC